MTSTGIVTYFNPSRGFGIIHSDDDDNDVVVTASDLSESGLDHLTRHCHVTFEPAREDDGRLHAHRVHLLQDPTVASARLSSFSRWRKAGMESIY